MADHMKSNGYLPDQREMDKSMYPPTDHCSRQKIETTITLISLRAKDTGRE